MDQATINHIRKSAEAGEPQAQFLLSQILQQQGQFDQAYKWVQQAHEAGVPEALDGLGFCFERGLGVEADFSTALDFYTQAVKAGLPQAAYRMAELLFKSSDGPAHEAQIKALLTKAAEHSYIPALRFIAYLAMESGQQTQGVHNTLAQAAHSGDPASAFNFAWFLVGENQSEELRPQAKFWFEQAAKANYPLAKGLIGQMPDCSPVQGVPPVSPVGFDLESVSLFPKSRQLEGKTFNESPCVKVFEQTLTLADCAYLIHRSSPYLQRAGVIDPGGDQAGQVSDVRTNSSTHLLFHSVDCISRYVELKIGAQVSQSLDHSEPMSVLRYQKGQRYAPHFDYFDPKLKVSDALLKNGGQRTVSAVTYLFAPPSGGGTSFPKLGLTIPAKTGDTIWFENCDQNGDIDPRSLHAGDVVEEGEKWVVTKWYRQRKTNYLLL